MTNNERKSLGEIQEIESNESSPRQVDQLAHQEQEELKMPFRDK